MTFERLLFRLHPLPICPFSQLDLIFYSVRTVANNLKYDTHSSRVKSLYPSQCWVMGVLCGMPHCWCSKTVSMTVVLVTVFMLPIIWNHHHTTTGGCCDFKPKNKSESLVEWKLETFRPICSSLFGPLFSTKTIKKFFRHLIKLELRWTFLNLCLWQI